MTILSLSLPTAATVLLLFLLAVNAQNTTSSSADAAAREDVCDRARFCVKRLERGEPCELLPIRKRSLLPQLLPGSYNLTKLRTGFWVFYDGSHQSVIMKMDRRLALIDFPDNSLPALVAATEEVLNGTVPKRVDMVYSHYHYDHIGGATRFHTHINEAFPGVFIQIWGTYETRRRIEASETKRAVKPNVIVRERGRTLSVGPGLDVKMSVRGGHTNQDLLMYTPRYENEASIVMMVDIVFPRWAPFLNLGTTIDVRRYIEVHDEILDFDFDFFLGGHTHIGNRKDVMRNLRYSRDIVRIAGRAGKQVTMEELMDAGLGKIADPVAPEFGNAWYVNSEVILKTRIDYCYREMLAKWGCTLAGLDVVLRSHCYTAVVYTLTDE